MMGRQTATLRLGFITWRSSPLARVYSAGHGCVADGELYAGTVSNFQGNEPIIYKTLSQGTSLKTENSLNWLQGTRKATIYSVYRNVKVLRWTHEQVFFLFFLSSPILDPAFVGSAYIQESLPKGNEVRDDDKIYFFFSEVGKEFDFFDNTIVSRIARVCKVSVALRQIVSQKGLFFFKCPPWATSTDNLYITAAIRPFFNPWVFVSAPEIYVISRVPPVSRADTLSLGSDAGSQKNISPRVFLRRLILFLQILSSPRLLIMFHQIFVFAQESTRELLWISARSVRRNGLSPATVFKLFKVEGGLTQHLSICLKVFQTL